MFNFLFIWRHKRSAQSYVAMTYKPPRGKLDVRYALSDTDTIGGACPLKGDNADLEVRPALPDVPASEPIEGPMITEGDGEDVPKSGADNLGDDFDASAVARAINRYLEELTPDVPLSSVTRLTFTQRLVMYIRDKGLDPADVYKAALMDRRLFSKIICDSKYKPGKDTVISLIFALKLSPDEAKDMLERAGYAISHSIVRDIIIEYFIIQRIYNLHKINAFLYHVGERMIGRY